MSSLRTAKTLRALSFAILIGLIFTFAPSKVGVSEPDSIIPSFDCTSRFLPFGLCTLNGGLILTGSSGIEGLSLLSSLIVEEGRVGIGTSEPSAQLHIIAGGNTSAAQLEGDVEIGTADENAKLLVRGEGQFDFTGRLSASISELVTTFDEDILAFHGTASNGHQRLLSFDNEGVLLLASSTTSFPEIEDGIRIDELGNVGIGTGFSPVGAKLDVLGDVVMGAVANENELGTSEALRISKVENFFTGTPLGDALFIEKTDDDQFVEGGLVLGFATSDGENIPKNSDDWATQHVPVIVIRGGDCDSIGERAPKVGIGTECPKSELEVVGEVALGNNEDSDRYTLKNSSDAPRFPGGLCFDSDPSTARCDIVFTPNGSIFKRGSNGFVAQHPNEPDEEIVYISLEGPEAGTYIRGTATLTDGVASIELPEHFSLVTADEGLTINLTPVGGWLQLFVAEKDTQKIVIHEARGRDGTFDYLVHGVRKGFESHQVVQSN